MSQGTQSHLETEVLQLHCLQDFVQDGDHQVNHQRNVPLPMDGQYGLEGCLLPHHGNIISPPVPQVQLARAVIPVQGSVLRTVLGSSGLHQDPGSPGGLAPAHGCAVLPVPQ